MHTRSCNSPLQSNRQTTPTLSPWQPVIRLFFFSFLWHYNLLHNHAWYFRLIPIVTSGSPHPSGNGPLASSETSYVHLRSVSTAVWHDVLIQLPQHLALGLYLLPFPISQASSFFLSVHCFKVLKDSPLELSNHIEAPGLVKSNEFMFQL